VINQKSGKWMRGVVDSVTAKSLHTFGPANKSKGLWIYFAFGVRCGNTVQQSWWYELVVMR